jgi:hypothetical protein
LGLTNNSQVPFFRHQATIPLMPMVYWGGEIRKTEQNPLLGLFRTEQNGTVLRKKTDRLL